MRRLPEGEALIYVAGCAPIRGARVPYWSDPELARRAAMPPPAESERARRDQDRDSAGQGQACPVTDY